MIRTILIIFFIFISIWWTTINVSKLIRNDHMYWFNFFIQAIGLTGVVTYFLRIW